MRVAIGCDHQGFDFKQTIIRWLIDNGYIYEDYGCFSTDSVDYPDIAREVAEAVAAGNFERGILICNNGIGMSMAANKVKGIRAALCYTAFNACRTRQHNDANILCLGAGEEQKQDPISDILHSFFTCEFEGGRHQRRVGKMNSIDG
jgi:ribose 5-phosphate isomerase B